MPFWIRCLKPTTTFWMGVRCSIGLNGIKVIHTVQLQIRMLPSPLEPMEQLSLFSTNMMDHRPRTIPTNVANGMSCPELLMSRQNWYPQEWKTSSWTQPQTRRPWLGWFLTSYAKMDVELYRQVEMLMSISLRQQSRHPWQSRPFSSVRIPIFWCFSFSRSSTSGLTHQNTPKCMISMFWAMCWGVMFQNISYLPMPLQGAILRLAYTVWERSLWSRSW